MALGEGPVNTGTFPNLNIAPKAAAPQLTDEETAAKLAALQRVQQQQGPRTYSETPEERRRRMQVITDDQAATLKEIEGN